MLDKLRQNMTKLRSDTILNKFTNTYEKNCKNMQINLKNCVKNAKNIKKYQNITNLSSKDLELLAWVKTLLCMHDTFPNIVKLIDKIVLTKSSSAGSGSLIFGDYKNGTYGQVEEVLKLEDRKVSIINLYTLVNTMVSSLKPQKQKFADLKFYKHKTMEYIAEELEVDERSVYRWANSVYLELLNYCLSNNWSLEFFYTQLASEGWLKEHYQKHYNYFLRLQKGQSKE